MDSNPQPDQVNYPSRHTVSHTPTLRVLLLFAVLLHRSAQRCGWLGSGLSIHSGVICEVVTIVVCTEAAY